MNIKRVKTKHYTKNYNVYKAGNTYYLKSYNSWVAKYSCTSGLFLGEDWEWGNTTKRHIIWFTKEIVGIGVSIPRLRDYIRDGLVSIVDCSPEDDRSIYRIE